MILFLYGLKIILVFRGGDANTTVKLLFAPVDSSEWFLKGYWNEFRIWHIDAFFAMPRMDLKLKWDYYVSFERCAEAFTEICVQSVQNELLNFQLLRRLIQRQMCIVWISGIAVTPHLLIVSNEGVFILTSIDTRIFKERMQLYKTYVQFFSL